MLLITLALFTLTFGIWVPKLFYSYNIYDFLVNYGHSNLIALSFILRKHTPEFGLIIQGDIHSESWCLVVHSSELLSKWDTHQI